MDFVTWLQDWYSRQCDGDWEQKHAISLQSLDNPGWLLKIDLEGTWMDARSFNAVNIERAKNDWVQCFVRDHEFFGAGGPHNLDEILKLFYTWASG